MNQIQVFYGDVQVLWEVSFKVEEKELAALVGANGAGKSTTLNTISSVLHPRGGTIEFNGQRIDNLQLPRSWIWGFHRFPRAAGCSPR